MQTVPSSVWRTKKFPSKAPVAAATCTAAQVLDKLDLDLDIDLDIDSGPDIDFDDVD